MKIIFCLFLMLPFGSDAQTTDEVIAYNDKIVGYQNEIIRAMLTMSEEIGVNGSTIESCEVLRVKSLEVIKTSTAELKKMTAFEGNDGFRLAALDLFNYYERILKNEYPELLSIIFKDDMTDTDFEIIGALSKKVSDEEEMYDKAFENEQFAFAKKYNLDLGENELQEEIDAIDE